MEWKWKLPVELGPSFVHGPASARPVLAGATRATDEELNLIFPGPRKPIESLRSYSEPSNCSCTSTIRFRDPFRQCQRWRLRESHSTGLPKCPILKLNARTGLDWLLCYQIQLSAMCLFQQGRKLRAFAFNGLGHRLTQDSTLHCELGFESAGSFRTLSAFPRRVWTRHVCHSALYYFCIAKPAKPVSVQGKCYLNPDMDWDVVPFWHFGPLLATIRICVRNEEPLQEHWLPLSLENPKQGAQTQTQLFSGQFCLMASTLETINPRKGFPFAARDTEQHGSFPEQPSRAHAASREYQNECSEKTCQIADCRQVQVSPWLAMFGEIIGKLT